MADLPAPQPRSLVDPGFDHDACGVGFMADTGRSAANRARVLPLALAGLAALGHRGAFAADGESSDGAGLLLPLEAPLRRLVGAPAGSAVVSLFLPQGRRRGRLARGIVGRSLAAEGLGRAVRRRVPVEPAALGQEARRSLPAVEQLVVPRPVGFGRRRFAQALLLAQRRMELGAAEAGLADFSVVSASAETLVYKGLVAGVRLAELYPDLAAPLALSHAVFHQRFATNTAPRWDLAQPFGRIAHNGEINTVRGNRAELRGRRADLGGRFGRRLTALGPLLDPRASDSRSLDELLAIMTAGGWSLPAALSAAIPEAVALRPDIALRADVAPRSDEATAPSASGSSASASSGAGERASWSGLLAPWDGPAAICFSDGRQVGALLDRSGLRPLSSTTTHAGLVGLASEAGAIPFTEAETAERGRLGPGQLLVVEPASGRILGEPAAPRRLAIAVPASPFEDRPTAALRALDARPPTPDPIRFLCGLDAERLRLDVRTMALEGHEPTWSMGDDTPLAGLGRPDRPLADHLRQSFAQVTNPALDPDRERIVMDLRVRLGPRPALLRGGRAETAAATVQLGRPIVADLAGLMEQLATGLELDATWDAAQGPGGLEAALDHLTRRALAAARRRVPLLVISDRGMTDGPSARLPIPSPLAVGAVHTALTEAGWRARTDILAQAADVLEVHGLAMALAAGATAVHPWLLLEVAAGQAGTRGAETLTREATVANVLAALEAGLRKVLARMGIATAASYVGGACFEALELRPEVVARCFPAAPSWPGRIGFAEIAARQLWRRDAAAALPAGGTRLPDPGLARFRGDGETHLWAPRIVRAAQGLARGEVAAEAYRATLGRRPAVVRDGLAVRAAPQPVPLAEVEPAAAIARRFVGAAMSLGSLSPEAHQAVAIGLRAVGAASNTGEGGEDPGWYLPDAEGRRHDAAIKQVASARFGVTATYLARAEQLEIKIAQGSKPGEGGQLPGRKATPLIATLRRSQPGRTLISPPPHHDIYSIEDLAQLVADLRAINPAARIGVKLVASRGVGTIAAGVAKAGADYVQISGHAGGTGASPLSSIKHAGLPFELGLAEAHQVLLDHGLRDRVALRADGGLQTGRDVLVAALLGAEEFGFGTAVLVALGCDMARQCHLDTCPTGIATQRPDLRAKFAGRPEDVVRLLTAVAEDVRL
ncbi:MAG TPA: glutamate synthase-related protein, partial [Candidatus Limnocylindrales bacterium]|nr:glutamate synthase-related protein [Candidatus Limnocylindrales bacterium]